MTVFGDVEFAKDHYCLLSTKATSRTIAGVDWVIESKEKVSVSYGIGMREMVAIG
jgi:hypothetical protein